MKTMACRRGRNDLCEASQLVTIGNDMMPAIRDDGFHRDGPPAYLRRHPDCFLPLAAAETQAFTFAFDPESIEGARGHSDRFLAHDPETDFDRPLVGPIEARRPFAPDRIFSGIELRRCREFCDARLEIIAEEIDDAGAMVENHVGVRNTRDGFGEPALRRARNRIELAIRVAVARREVC